MFRYLSETSFFRHLLWSFKMKQCPHPPHRMFCFHGDEIKARNDKRSFCDDCHKTFKKLLDICSHTGMPHDVQ